MTERPPQHPLPWLQGPSGWMRLTAEEHEEDEPDGRMIRQVIGHCENPMTRAELGELYRRIGDILVAPYRLIVAGGAGVPSGQWRMIEAWLDELCEGVKRHGWRMQVVTTAGNDAQDAVAGWCTGRDVEWYAMDRLDLTIGGNVVGVFPCPDVLDIVRHVRLKYHMAVYRIAPEALWAKPAATAGGD